MSLYALQSFRSQINFQLFVCSSLLFRRIGIPRVSFSHVRKEHQSSSSPQYVPPVTKADVKRLLKTSGGYWTLAEDGLGLERTIKFQQFTSTKAFIEQLLAKAQNDMHHPEWSNIYSSVFIRLTTHKSQRRGQSGISMKDIAMASFCDTIARDLGVNVNDTGGRGHEFPFRKGRSILAALKDTSYSLKNSCAEAQAPFDQIVDDGGILPLQGVKPSNSKQEIVIDVAEADRWSLMRERLEKLELEVNIIRQTIRAGETGEDNIQHSTELPGTISEPLSDGDGARRPKKGSIKAKKRAIAKWAKESAMKASLGQKRVSREAALKEIANEDKKTEGFTLVEDRKHNDNVFTVVAPKGLQSRKAVELSKRPIGRAEPSQAEKAERQTQLKTQEEFKSILNDLSPTAKASVSYKASMEKGKNGEPEKVQKWHIPKLGQERKAGKEEKKP